MDYAECLYVHRFVKKKKKNPDHFIDRKKHLKSIELCRDHRQYTRSVETKQAIHHNRYSTVFSEKTSVSHFSWREENKN